MGSSQDPDPVHSTVSWICAPGSPYIYDRMLFHAVADPLWSILFRIGPLTTLI